MIRRPIMSWNTLGTGLASFSVGAWLVMAPLDGTRLITMSLHAGINLGGPTASRSVATGDVGRALKAASEATGVDFAYLTANASLESSLDPRAKAKTSSAAGLFQFIESTWAGMVEKHGPKIGLEKEAAALASGDVSPTERRRIMNLRFDPGVSARMGAEFTAENAGRLRQGLGREPEDVDLYLAHFLGPGGAVKFLKRLDAAPNAAAATAFPEAARANPAVFYKGDKALSLAAVRDRFDAKLAGRMGDSPPAAQPTPVRAGAPKPVALLQSPTAGVRPGGDPWLSTLVNAQLSMSDALTRVSRDEPAQDETYRSLMS